MKKFIFLCAITLVPMLSFSSSNNITPNDSSNRTKFCHHLDYTERIALICVSVGYNFGYWNCGTSPQIATHFISVFGEEFQRYASYQLMTNGKVDEMCRTYCATTKEYPGYESALDYYYHKFQSILKKNKCSKDYRMGMLFNLG